MERSCGLALGETMIVEPPAHGPTMISEVLVWDGIKRIDFMNHFDKEQTYDKEAVYFAFPFAAQKPTIRYEVPCGIVNANTDMLPGACLDWFTVQHFVEVDAGTRPSPGPRPTRRWPASRTSTAASGCTSSPSPPATSTPTR